MHIPLNNNIIKNYTQLIKAIKPRRRKKKIKLKDIENEYIRDQIDYIESEPNINEYNLFGSISISLVEYISVLDYLGYKLVIKEK